ncbi:hypothetical protein BKA69DRAFT_1129384 [Paraphysoderma sedebokerense]|nr:hypothetical protein BKA69DRAFT_1129384 [Paraphysoderma sedebokerense]
MLTLKCTGCATVTADETDFWNDNKLYKQCCRCRNYPPFAGYVLESLKELDEILNQTIVDAVCQHTDNPDMESASYSTPVIFSALVRVIDDSNDRDVDEIAQRVKISVMSADGYTYRYRLSMALSLHVFLTDTFCRLQRTDPSPKMGKRFKFFCSQRNSIGKYAENPKRTCLRTTRYQCNGLINIFVPKDRSYQYIGMQYEHHEFHPREVNRSVSEKLKLFIKDNIDMSGKAIFDKFREDIGNYDDDHSVTQQQVTLSVTLHSAIVLLTQILEVYYSVVDAVADKVVSFKVFEVVGVEVLSDTEELTCVVTAVDSLALLEVTSTDEDGSFRVLEAVGVAVLSDTDELTFVVTVVDSLALLGVTSVDEDGSFRVLDVAGVDVLSDTEELTFVVTVVDSLALLEVTSTDEDGTFKLLEVVGVEVLSDAKELTFVVTVVDSLALLEVTSTDEDGTFKLLEVVGVDVLSDTEELALVVTAVDWLALLDSRWIKPEAERLSAGSAKVFYHQFQENWDRLIYNVVHENSLRFADSMLIILLKYVPTQTDGYNCGVFIIEYARRMAFGLDMSTPFDPNALRAKIQGVIEQGSMGPFEECPA